MNSIIYPLLARVVIVRKGLKRKKNTGGSFLMLDIKDKKGKVVAVLLDDGTIVRREKATDDIDEIIRERLKKLGKESR